jgi:hypothetical protein
VFYAVLYEENPVRIEEDIAGLEGREKLLLQKVAWPTAGRERKV